MAYVIQNGESGYSRANFMSALEGKQNVLQSGVNIKTVDGKSVLGSGNLEISEREYSYDLTQEERDIVDDVKTLLNKYNPNKEFVTFGFITDTHAMPTKAQMQEQDDVEEVVSAIQSQGITLEPVSSEGTIADEIRSTWPSSDDSYYGNISAENYIKMIGAVAYEQNLDLVIHGGDASSGRLPYNCYAYMLEKMARMFDKYISVPHVICQGNHDYQYNSAVAVRTNSEWRKFCQRFNATTGLQFRYVKDYQNAQAFAQEENVDISDYTSFSLDIDKGGFNKLRFASSSPFEKNGDWSAIARHFAFDLSDKEHIDLWSAVGIWHIQPSSFLSNYASRFFNGTGGGKGSNSQDYDLPASHGGTKPKSFAGYIFGHNHDSVYGRLSFTGGYSPQIRVANSFENSVTPATFSVFIFDTINWWLYEIIAVNKRRTSTTFTEEVYENTDNLDHAWCYRYKLSHN